MMGDFLKGLALVAFVVIVVLIFTGNLNLNLTSKFSENDIFVDGFKSTVSDICYICKTSIIDDDFIGVPDNCDHWFHLGCIRGWIGKGNHNCPECGARFDKIIKTPFKQI
jgi:hypothetical protein